MNETADRSGWPVGPDVLDAIRALQIRVLRVVEGFMGGAHSSPHLGSSIEFAEHKKYTPGDDLRYLDWRAFARTDRYFVKQQEREVTLQCLMLLDCSASMGYGGSRAADSKIGFSVVLLAALAHILLRQGDAVGLLSFSDGCGDIVPPRRRPEHLAAIMASLANAKPSSLPGTAYDEAFRVAAAAAGRRALVVVASDLWGAGPNADAALRRLSARGHDVALLHVLDPDEIDLPFHGPAVFDGLEGEPSVETDPSLVREDYRREIAAVRETWRRACGEAGIDYTAVVTDSPPETVLTEFAARRRQARKSR